MRRDKNTRAQLHETPPCWNLYSLFTRCASLSVVTVFYSVRRFWFCIKFSLVVYTNWCRDQDIDRPFIEHEWKQTDSTWRRIGVRLAFCVFSEVEACRYTSGRYRWMNWSNVWPRLCDAPHTLWWSPTDSMRSANLAASELVKSSILRAILCKNQRKWEMKNFEPPTQIYLEVGPHEGCSRMSIIEVITCLLYTSPSPRDA